MRRLEQAGAPMEQYASPPELGGLRGNMPIIDSAVPQLMGEVATDWAQTIAGGENIGIPQYDGDVWSIQLTARPGYYVSPEVQQEIGWGAYGEVPPDA